MTGYRLFISAQTTELARFPRSRLATLFFIKISMIMRGQASPVTEILVTKMKIFQYEHCSPVTRTNFCRQNSFAWSCCISTFEVCESALLVKLQESTKLLQSRTIQVYVSQFGLCFLNSPRLTGLKFPTWTHHRIRPGNWASLVTRLIWRGP